MKLRSNSAPFCLLTCSIHTATKYYTQYLIFLELFHWSFLQTSSSLQTFVLSRQLLLILRTIQGFLTKIRKSQIFPCILFASLLLPNLNPHWNPPHAYDHKWGWDEKLLQQFSVNIDYCYGFYNDIVSSSWKDNLFFALFLCAFLGSSSVQVDWEDTVSLFVLVVISAVIVNTSSSAGTQHMCAVPINYYYSSCNAQTNKEGKKEIKALYSNANICIWAWEKKWGKWEKKYLVKKDKKKWSKTEKRKETWKKKEKENCYLLFLSFFWPSPFSASCWIRVYIFRKLVQRGSCCCLGRRREKKNGEKCGDENEDGHGVSVAVADRIPGKNCDDDDDDNDD